MNVKPLFLGLLVTAISLTTFAQKSEVNSVKSNLEKYTTLANAPILANASLKAAKESADKAILNEKTKNDPELWAMRTRVYAEMALLDTASTSEANIKEMQVSLAKAKELDLKADTKEHIKSAFNALYRKQLLRGKKEYDTQNYAGAYQEFNKGLDYMPGDTILNYYAGISAQNSQNYKAAIKSYSDLLPTNFSYIGEIYGYLSDMYIMDKDTASAIKTLTDAYVKFPTNTKIFDKMIVLSLNAGKYKDVITKLEPQIKQEPANKIYPFYLGLAYSGMDNSDKAEESYKKAVELDPDFLEANINLGGLILNRGIDLSNKLVKQYGKKQLTPAQVAQYNTQKKQAIAEYEKALPYLAKATELNPKSKMAWINLRAYYEAKEDEAKITEINNKIQAIQAGK